MIEPMFEAEQNRNPQTSDWCIRFIPPNRVNEDGSRTLFMSLPLLVVTDYAANAEGIASQVATILEENRYRFSHAGDAPKEQAHAPVLNIQTTSRGHRFATFTDAGDIGCSIQDSSVKNSEGLIWLGDRTTGRMHLTQSHVRALLPILQHFIAHGALPDGETGDTP